MLTSGTTLTIVCFPSSAQKKSTWLNRAQNVISGKDSTSKFVFEVRNNPQKIAGSPHLFTQQTTTHFIWFDSVKVSTWVLEQILALRRMVPPKFFSMCDPEWKMILAKSMRITLTWKALSSNKPATRIATWTWFMKCTAGRRSTIFSSKVPDSSKQLKYSYYRTNVNKSVPRSSLTWCSRLRNPG